MWGLWLKIPGLESGHFRTSSAIDINYSQEKIGTKVRKKNITDVIEHGRIKKIVEVRKELKEG